jgi:16S rRNA processing protein RimM
MIEVRLGRLARVHGLAGELAVAVSTDLPERRFASGAAVAAGRPGAVPRRLTVAGSRRQGGRLLLRFAEVADRTAAEALVGAELTAAVEPGEAAGGPDEFFDRQLRGLIAADPRGRPVGTVADILHQGAQDLLVIATVAGPRLVPFVAALVPAVDLAAGSLTVADLPGLLDDRADTEPPDGDAPPDGPNGSAGPDAAAPSEARDGSAKP